jgi:hypothetical protein
MHDVMSLALKQAVTLSELGREIFGDLGGDQS